ncbi:MAG: cytochrome-c peroxidase [Thalassobius sp.]|nr:cytochrome-c peroxidase [Thalassovita sp.]
MKSIWQRKYILSTWAVIAVFIFAFVVQNEPEPYIIEYPAYFGGRFSIPKDNPTTQEGIALGRMLFYENKLSKNNAISCASCHQQKLAFTDGKTFSTGADGLQTKRNAMSLSNLLWVRNFFWDGRAKGLEAQAVFPMIDSHEMNQSLDVTVEKLKETEIYPQAFNKAFGSTEITANKIVKAIAQFERTLISADSKYDQYLSGAYSPTEQELRGMELFMTVPQPQKNIRGANCGHCHGTPKIFKELFHNNGLDSNPTDIGRMEFTGQEIDRGRFRVATLRNIALTAPYMHDGRFKTLEEVLDHYNEHVQPSATLSPFISDVSNEIDGESLALTQDEKKDIIAFLHMLTDSTFINNPKFSNPFKS